MGKVLIIDDNRHFRAEVKLVLEEESFQVSEAVDGADGIERFREDEPDVVLLDLKMPGKDGLEVLPELEEMAPHVPVVMLTGFGDTDIIVEAMKKGAFNFVDKPPDFARLVPMLKEAVEKKQKANLCRKLSQKEFEVLKLKACGMRSSDMAEILQIKERTIKSYMESAMNKLDATSSHQAVMKCISLGLIDPKRLPSLPYKSKS